MITRINHLRNFGIFHDFTGNEASGIQPFSRLNLIYGWNYSGKTTLSRVFQTLERKGLAREYSPANFRIAQEDGPELSPSDLAQAPTVRVFNRDYVAENFRKEHSAPAVFIVGKENADLKARLAQLQGRWALVENKTGELRFKKSAIQGQISSLGTNKARDIGNLLGDRNFRRPNLEQRIGDVRHALSPYLLNDESIQARLVTLRSGETFSELSKINPNLPSLTELVSEVKVLMSQTASSSEVM